MTTTDVPRRDLADQLACQAVTADHLGQQEALFLGRRLAQSSPGAGAGLSSCFCQDGHGVFTVRVEDEAFAIDAWALLAAE